MSDPRLSGHPATLSLPEYRVRVSPRARHISLRVLPGKGLEVVLPPHADPSCVPAIVERRRAWIDKALGRVCAHWRGGAPHSLPRLIFLKGGREALEVMREKAPGRGKAKELLLPAGESPLFTPGPSRAAPVPAVALTRPPLLRRLLLPGGEDAAALALLRGWVREEAGRWLEPILAGMADEHGYSYAAARFRFQKSRWGSCSVKGNINLNACLLFLPESLARYILLHELCHTKQMNHSDAFWRLVFAADPEALGKDRAMRAAWNHVPPWVMG